LAVDRWTAGSLQQQEQAWVRAASARRRLLRPNGPGTEIEGRRFRSQAAAFDSELLVPSDPANPTLYSRTRPAAALDASGDLIVAWESNGQDGSGLGVFAQGLSPQLVRNGFEFQVNGAAPGSATGDQSAPSVASSAGGLAAIVWQGPNGAGTTSLFGHLYETADNFFTVTPCRLVDTRNAANTAGGFQGTGAPALSNGVPRTPPPVARTRTVSTAGMRSDVVVDYLRDSLPPCEGLDPSLPSRLFGGRLRTRVFWPGRTAASWSVVAAHLHLKDSAWVLAWCDIANFV
jgi:hypothetical protein